MNEPICPSCYIEDIPLPRYALGYRTCLTCGEKHAKKVKHTVAPMPKSNYMLFTDLSLLKGLNSSHKGGLT
jgi:ribosomal protein L37AE/L43A